MPKKKNLNKIITSPPFISNKIIHRGDYHGLRKSSWEFLKKGDEKDFARFEKKYFESLSNRAVPQRTRYAINFLEAHGFQSLGELTCGSDIGEMLDRGSDLDWVAGDKFYLTFQEDCVIACQLGKKKFKEGVNFIFAHTDSPYVKGKGSFKQENGIAYMLAEPYGDFVSSNWFSVPLAMHFKGYASKNGCKPIEFVIGDRDGEPRFSIPNESKHLDDKEDLTRKQLKVIIGSKPYSKKAYPCKTALWGALEMFYKGFGVTESDFKKGQTTFFHSKKPERTGVNSSNICSFGQDDLACAFPSLYAFSKLENPTYTCFLQLHPGEEIGDEGRAAVTGNFISEVVVPAVAEMRGDSLGAHYRGLLTNSISIWGDVSEATHACNPELHDPYDSFYLNSGIGITRQSGDEDRWKSYTPSPRALQGFSNLFDEKGIPYLIGTMGHSEERIPGCNAIHGPLFAAEGIDWIVPLLGMHRGQGETTSPIDIFFFYKGLKEFFNLPNRSIFPKKHDLKAEPQRLKPR